MIRLLSILALIVAVTGCTKPEPSEAVEPSNEIDKPAIDEQVIVQCPNSVELTEAAATQIRKIQRDNGDPLYVEVSFDADSHYKLDLIDMIDPDKHSRSETHGLTVAITHEAMAKIGEKLVIDFVNDKEGQRFKIMPIEADN